MVQPEPPEETHSQRAREIIRQLRRGERPAQIVGRLNRLQALDYSQDIRLKRFYGYFLPSIMIGQLLIADLGFFLYAVGVDWDVETSVMHVWLGATVIEVIAVVVIVTRYLFPRRDIAIER